MTTIPIPAPTQASITPKPIEMPNICGIVRLKPKFTPDANSITLFGPGVIEDTSEKTHSAIKISKVIGTIPI